MKTQKLAAGDSFPRIIVPSLGGDTLQIGCASSPHDWQLVIVYRGKHCPLCTKFLNQLNEALPAFHELGVDVIAVSADPLSKAKEQIEPLNLDYAVGYDLSLEQMLALGLYISHPRSPEETDRVFAEPGAFIINEAGTVQIVSLSNVPFIRPNIPSLLSGLGFIRNPDNNYPIRGTYSEAG